MRNARLAACAIWLAALLTCPAAATAASVVAKTDCDKYGCRDSLLYSAARGERNDVTVVEESDLVTIRDTAGIQPRGACEALDALSARCTLHGYSRSARFDLRDQPDELDARALASAAPHISGGAGNDRLAGPDAIAATFVGGPGNDEMTGGTSPDRFESSRSDGRDTMAGGGPPPLLDLVFPVHDEVMYNRSRSVRVELDGRPNDGARGEHDNLLDIEGVWTGAGNDVVIGSSGSEYMYGGAGRDLLRGLGGTDRLIGGDRVVLRRDIPVGSPDRLEGGDGPDTLDAEGGRDLLIGGSGRDQLDGGRGADRIRAGDPDRDWVMCGLGVDRLAASAADVLMRGCERRGGAMSGSEGIVNWSYGGGTATGLIVACPVAAPQDCEGTITVSLPGRPQPLSAYPTPTYSIEPGMATQVSFFLDAKDIDGTTSPLNGAVASTPNDSARFGELPDWYTDSQLDAFGVPGL